MYSEETSTLTICGDGKSIAMPKDNYRRYLYLTAFISLESDDSTAVCKASVEEIYEGSLPGYHMGAISLIFLLGKMD